MHGRPPFVCTIDSSRTDQDSVWSEDGGATLIANGSPWNPDQPDPDLLSGVDAVIHLAGASIAGRFTESHRAAIRDSRIGPTRRLAELMAKSPDGPKVLICDECTDLCYGIVHKDELP